MNTQKPLTKEEKAFELMRKILKLIEYRQKEKQQQKQ